jgi:hypothetical protein
MLVLTFLSNPKTFYLLRFCSQPDRSQFRRITTLSFEVLPQICHKLLQPADVRKDVPRMIYKKVRPIWADCTKAADPLVSALRGIETVGSTKGGSNARRSNRPHPEPRNSATFGHSGHSELIVLSHREQGTYVGSTRISECTITPVILHSSSAYELTFSSTKPSDFHRDTLRI